MCAKKEMKELVWELEADGWRVEKGKTHTKCYHPLGGFITVSGTPRGIYAANQARRDANRLDKKNREQSR